MYILCVSIYAYIFSYLLYVVLSPFPETESRHILGSTPSANGTYKLYHDKKVLHSYDIYTLPTS